MIARLILAAAILLAIPSPLASAGGEGMFNPAASLSSERMDSDRTNPLQVRCVPDARPGGYMRCVSLNHDAVDEVRERLDQMEN